MQQRRLRLGDILDDYCPRERRITNHAVVAKIDDDVRQTRCLTCDTEHEYRQGKAPTLRKKKDNVSAAYREVLAEVTKGAPAAAAGAEPDAAPAAAEPAAELAGAVEPPAHDDPLPAEAVVAEATADAGAEEAGEANGTGEAEAEGDEPAGAEQGRVHRRLIRATLPRSENQQVVRPIPQFTMRQPTGRAGKFRPAPGRGQRPTQGARVGASGAGRTFPSRGSGHNARPPRAEGQRARGAHPRHGKKHSK